MQSNSGITIRQIQFSDIPEITRWWDECEQRFDLSFIPLVTTFVAEIDGELALSMSLICTSTPIGWLEFFVGNPKWAGNIRKEATIVLVDHMVTTARNLGFRRLFCMAPCLRLSDYYVELGFTKTGEGILTLIREI